MAGPQAISPAGMARPFSGNAASDQQCLEMEGSRGQRVLGAPLHAGGLMSDGSKTASLEVEMLEVEMCFNTALSS